ncbi:hypothetical protein BYT27DRAFT_7333127 [Phlegmacium glaucopus]|nr:hypothetical protein BYT27DRAFT_7333127 [Phlegmacium glaucopus]
MAHDLCSIAPFNQTAANFGIAFIGLCQPPPVNNFTVSFQKPAPSTPNDPISKGRLPLQVEEQRAGRVVYSISSLIPDSTEDTVHAADGYTKRNHYPISIRSLVPLRSPNAAENLASSVLLHVPIFTISRTSWRPHELAISPFRPTDPSGNADGFWDIATPRVILEVCIEILAGHGVQRRALPHYFPLCGYSLNEPLSKATPHEQPRPIRELTCTDSILHVRMLRLHSESIPEVTRERI